MEFKNIRALLRRVRLAIEKYNMIEEGDCIAVGVSGGKDSMALLAALVNLKMFYPKSFKLCAITVSMGFEGMDFSPIERFCSECGVEYKLVKTELAKVIFEDRREKSPCSLCARMRRGMLHDAAKEMGCNKLALGHHYDDVVETFMLNLFHEGRIGAFLPVTYLSRKDLTMIRPLIYAEESEIKRFISSNELPEVRNACPEDGRTERERMKKLLASLEGEYKGLKSRLFTAMENGGVFEKTEEQK